MRLFNFCLLIVSIWSCNTFASSTLNIAEAFNILAINGKSYTKGLLSQDRKLELRTGLNKLVIEYEEVFESDDGDNFDIIKSSPFLLTVYLQGGQNYIQRLVKPMNAKAARQFIRQPMFEIVALNSGGKSSGVPVKFELQPAASTDEIYLTQLTRLKERATLDLSVSQNLPKADLSTSDNIQANKASSKAVQMLNYWWDKATEEEKALFLAKIKAATKN